jgi:hypothetical protein
MADEVRIEKIYCMMYFLEFLIKMILPVYYTTSFTELPKDMYNKSLSICFLIHIMAEWEFVFEHLLGFLPIFRCYGMTISKDLLSRMHPMNIHHTFLFRIIKLIRTISFFAGFITVSRMIPFTDECGIFKDYHDSCLSMKIISIFFIILYCLMAVVMCGLCKSRMNENNYDSIITNSITPNSRNPRNSRTNSSNNIIVRYTSGYFPTIPITPSDNECSICLEAVNPNDRRVLGCTHQFHPACITPWLNQNPSCPICRTHVSLINNV